MRQTWPLTILCAAIFLLGGFSFVLGQPPPTADTIPTELTAQQWREDLEFARNTFLAKDRSFSPAEREAFLRATANIENSLAGMSREKIIVELTKAVALSRNAHTRLYLLRNRSELRRYPIRVWWFSDGLYVVRSAPAYGELLGAKVTKIAGKSLVDLRRMVDPLYAGNESWHKYLSTYTMTSPDILFGLDLAGKDGAVDFEFGLKDGRGVRKHLPPEPLRRSTQPTESWWDLCPNMPRIEPWKYALVPGTAGLPLYLRDVEKQYWSAYLEQNKLYYIHFSRSGDAPEGEKFADFEKRAIAELKQKTIGSIVVDLRFNTGGNLDVARGFVDEISAFAKQNQVAVYVVTGQATFSAGIYHAMQLKEGANAKLVGEDYGDGLDFWSEGGNLVMPNSKLTLHYADLFHSYSATEYPENSQFLIHNTDLSIKNGKLDISIPTSSKDYFAGRDPVLEAIKKISKH